MAAVLRRLLACALLAAPGCGLRDYEAHIDAQHKRIDAFDEENRLLGEAIEIPKYKNKEGEDVPFWPFDIYLRLPRDIAGALQANCQFNDHDLPLFRYLGRDNFNAFVAAGTVADKNAKPKPAEWLPDTFREYVRGALMEYYRREYRVNPQFPAFDRAKFQKMPKQTAGENGIPGPIIELDAIAFKDDFNRALKESSLFYVYFYQRDTMQVAVVFQSPESWAKDENVIKAIDWSLRTLEIGPAAALKRGALLNRRK